MKLESRIFTGSELRASEGDEMALVGYAAMFNSLSEDLGGFKETIAPGAFTRALRENQDVRCLFNHSADKILGRTSAGTLQLEQDGKGLKMRCQLDRNQQWHRDLWQSVKRGDVSQMSFGFTCPQNPPVDDWDEGTDDRGQRFCRRTLKDVNLLDVSAVVYAAYQATSISARSIISPAVQSALQTLSHEAWRKVMLKRADKIAEELRHAEALDAVERSKATGFIFVRTGAGEFDGYFDVMTPAEFDRHLQRRADQLGAEIRSAEEAERAKDPMYGYAWDYKQYAFVREEK